MSDFILTKGQNKKKTSLKIFFGRGVGGGRGWGWGRGRVSACFDKESKSAKKNFCGEGGSVNT